MPRHKRDRIAHFGDRLDWVRENLVAAGPVQNPAAIRDDRDLRLSVRSYLEETNPHNTFEEKAWGRWRKEGGVSEAVLASIREIYSGTKDNGVDLLKCDWLKFQKATSTAESARIRWESATQLFRLDRARVEQFGKKVYQDVDQLNDVLPLIGLESWIPEKAILLQRGERTEHFRWIADHSEGGCRRIALPGLRQPYHLLKVRTTNRSGRPPFNGECYLISDVVREADKFEIKLRRGRYFDYIDTCEAHAALLSDLIQRGICPEAHDVDKALNNSAWTRKTIFDWGNRTTFLGVNCLLIAKNYHPSDASKGRSVFWLHRRSAKTIEAQNVWHVAPAGGHQPLSKGHLDPDEMSIWYTAVRELLEEIFDRNDLAGHDRKFGDHFQVDPDTGAIFRAVVESGAAQIYYLGLALDPATTKPEALCAIVLDWAVAEKEIYTKRTRHLNTFMAANWEGDLHPYPLLPILMREMATSPRPHETMLPAGASCLLLAAKHIESGSIVL